jgi:hypothetical protein
VVRKPRKPHINGGYAYLSVQVPMQKNECLQTANRNSELGLDGKGTLKEGFVVRPFRWHEVLDIDIGRRRRATRTWLGSVFPVEPTCAVVELGERPEREYKIHGAYETWIVLLRLARVKFSKAGFEFVM